jgi:hypothetical protein
LKFLIKICLILFCSLQAKTEFDGKWYKLGTNWQIYINITSTNEGQILEQYMKVADNQNLVYTKKIHKNWLGKVYTKTNYLGKSYKSGIKYIDDKTIMYGNELYKKYDLPRDFLKGN